MQVHRNNTKSHVSSHIFIRMMLQKRREKKFCPCWT